MTRLFFNYSPIAIHLNDLNTGLMFHAYDESGQSTWADKETKHSAEIWCRAMGWFGMTMIEVLELLPRDHPMRPLLVGHSAYSLKRGRVIRTRKPGSGIRWSIRATTRKLARNFELEHVHVRHCDGSRSWLCRKKYRAKCTKRLRGVLTKISLDQDGQTNIINICEAQRR